MARVPMLRLPNGDMIITDPADRGEPVSNVGIIPGQGTSTPEMVAREQARAASGAKVECPFCGQVQEGGDAFKLHITQLHGDAILDSATQNERAIQSAAQRAMAAGPGLATRPAAKPVSASK